MSVFFIWSLQYQPLFVLQQVNVQNFFLRDFDLLLLVFKTTKSLVFQEKIYNKVHCWCDEPIQKNIFDLKYQNRC